MYKGSLWQPKQETFKWRGVGLRRHFTFGQKEKSLAPPGCAFRNPSIHAVLKTTFLLVYFRIRNPDLAPHVIMCNWRIVCVWGPKFTGEKEYIWHPLRGGGIYGSSLPRIAASYVRWDAFTHSEKHKTVCTEPIKRNPFKGFAVRCFPPLSSSFWNHEVPRDNQMYIVYLPNTNGLEQRVKDGRAEAQGGSWCHQRHYS